MCTRKCCWWWVVRVLLPPLLQSHRCTLARRDRSPAETNRKEKETVVRHVYCRSYWTSWYSGFCLMRKEACDPTQQWRVERAFPWFSDCPSKSQQPILVDPQINFQTFVIRKCWSDRFSSYSGLLYCLSYTSSNFDHTSLDAVAFRRQI